MNWLKKLFGGKTSTEKVPERTGTPQEQYERFMEVLKPYQKTCYIPVTETVPPAFDSSNKMGGYPYLRDPDDWPKCPNCGQHRQLFLQLDLSSLPEKSKAGVVQLFYCTNVEAECDINLGGYAPFSKGHVRRLIQPNGPSASTTVTTGETFPEKRITDWTPRLDYPHYEDYPQLGIGDALLEDEVYELMEEKGGHPLTGDKLFGWPRGVQYPEMPINSVTGKEYSLLFQIDSHDNIPYFFGYDGIGHLTYNPDDSSDMAFGWACH